MERVMQLRRSNSTILWAFPAFTFSYIIFLSNLNALSNVLSVPIRQNSIFIQANDTLLAISNIQEIALIAAMLLVSVALVFQAGASMHRYLICAAWVRDDSDDGTPFFLAVCLAPGSWQRLLQPLFFYWLGRTVLYDVGCEYAGCVLRCHLNSTRLLVTNGCTQCSVYIYFTWSDSYRVY